MTATTIIRPADPTLSAALRLALLFAACKLLFHFALTLYTQHIGYSFFRDEFYYIACGRHLAWGYVDHGPIVALQARLGEILFGDSLFRIRILSAAAGAVMIFLTGIIAWALGGRRSAQALAMLALFCAPQFIGTDGFLSMNSFEPMFWMLCILSLLLILRERSAAIWWTIFGISAGIGLLNKPSMLFFLLALGFGLLCTPERRLLFTRWAALGIALLILIPTPHLIWQVTHHWPTLEFLHNGRVGHKNAILSPPIFFLAQFGNMQPVNALIWITGVIALLRAKSIARARWLGIAFLVFYLVMETLHAKDYYLAPIYPALFAAGAIAWERRFSASRLVREGRIFAFPIFTTVLVLTTLLILPMASPILRPETWVRYTSAMHLRPPNSETFATGPLPQFYADRFGWQELTDQTVSTFRGLSVQDQQQVCIFASNYGEAGAINFLGPRQETHLPQAISGQNNFWLWGPRGCTGQLVIAIVHDKPEDLLKKYKSVTIVGRMDNPWAMPFEHRNIYLLRDKRKPGPIDWAGEKDFF